MAKARQLLTEAAYPNGFDAGEMIGAVQSTTVEAVISGLKARPLPHDEAGRVPDGVEGQEAGESPVLRRRRLRQPGGHPDLDDLFQQQARELDRRKRQALLHRVAKPSLGRIPRHYYTAPFEDVRLRGN